LTFLIAVRDDRLRRHAVKHVNNKTVETCTHLSTVDFNRYQHVVSSVNMFVLFC